MTDDARDLTASLAGDHQAFARLYDRHAAVVLSLCRTRCANEAEDALQETFLRAYRMLDQLNGPEQLRPWLYAIARRVCSERRRARMRRSHHEERAMIVQPSLLTTDRTAPDPIDRADQLDRLSSAIESLPDDERLAIHIFYLDGDPVTAAASALGLSRSGFYKLLARARQKLAYQMRKVPST